jgi:hypothetical protein
MRWHTSKHESPKEAAERKELSRKIDAWWDIFRKTAPTISEFFSVREAHKEFNIAEWMQEHLGSVDENLMWEFGRALKGNGHRLVITPEGSRHLRPLADEILRRAPTDSGFEFYGDRLAESLEEAIEMAKSRTQAEIVVTGITCKPGIGNRVDLIAFVRPKASDEELDLAWSQVIIICSTLMGEDITDRWLGFIDVEHSNPSSVSLEFLKPQFEAAMNTCKAARPTMPYINVSEDANWTMYEMKPDPDHEITRRSDLFVYSALDPAFFQTVFRRLPFYSERFSSQGERFCYLMLDGRDAAMEGFDSKSAIEEALEAALVPQQLGAIVGTGTGTRYSYIDLALTDTEQACPTIIEVLRKGGIVKNAWILFHDDEWHDEWIGAYEDTPPPLARSAKE